MTLIRSELMFSFHFFSELGIKSNQHFCLFSDDLGHVKASFTLKKDEERRFILDPAIASEGGPSQIVPPGMSQQRKVYLFNSIRQFVDSSKKDILCPQPYISGLWILKKSFSGLHFHARLR